jgi:hypothetical protein
MKDNNAYAGLDVNAALARAREDGYKKICVVDILEPPTHCTADIDKQRITIVTEHSKVISSYVG